MIPVHIIADRLAAKVPESLTEAQEDALLFVLACRLEERRTGAISSPQPLPRGRPRANDGPAFEEMDRLLAADAAMKVESAARVVAAGLPSQHNVESTTKRLARRYRERQEQNSEI
jgi:hypothetical protein